MDKCYLFYYNQLSEIKEDIDSFIYYEDKKDQYVDIIWQNKYLNFRIKKTSSSDPCYMIYTSGTTGKPKGAMISNKNIANFVSNNIFTSKLKILIILVL